jgi:hypothetical protein
MDGKGRIMGHFIRVDNPFDCPRVAVPYPRSDKRITVHCTLGAPITRYVADYSFPDGTTYREFIGTVVTSRGLQARWLPIYKCFGDHGIHKPEDFDLYVIRGSISSTVESATTMLVGLDGLAGPAIRLGLDRIAWAGLYQDVPLEDIFNEEATCALILTPSVNKISRL